MLKIAVVYSSTHGQTEKIARYLEDKLQERGFSTQLLQAETGDHLSSEVDAVIYGSPVYRGRFARPLVRWVKTHRPLLTTMPTALFTVSLNAADKRPEARADDRRLIQELIAETGFTPRLTASFAGALNYRSYFWPVRWLMKRIARRAGGDTDTSKDYEYTNWSAVESFLSRFLLEEILPRVPAYGKYSAEIAKAH